jgi:hypothetical protein
MSIIFILTIRHTGENGVQYAPGCRIKSGMTFYMFGCRSNNIAAFCQYCAGVIEGKMKCAGYRRHLQVKVFRYVIEVRIISCTEVSDSDSESVVLHHLLTPVRYV